MNKCLATTDVAGAAVVAARGAKFEQKIFESCYKKAKSVLDKLGTQREREGERERERERGGL